MMNDSSVIRSTGRPSGRSRYILPVTVFIVLLAAAVFVYGWISVFNRLSIFTTVFLSIFIEAAPFLLLGSLASALVEIFFTDEDFSRWMPGNPAAAALAGVFLGFFFPVCECGVVPFTRRLFQKGLPLSAGISFLLAAPALNPIVLASTYIAFGWGPVLWGRVGLTFVVALVTGLVFGLQQEPQQLFNRSTRHFLQGDSILCLQHGERPAGRQKLQRIFAITADEFFDTGRFLVLGAALSSLVQTVFPQSLLLGVGQGAVLSVFVMIALAVLLSVCSTVDAFIALSFAGSFTTGSLLAFLTFGPMVDIKSTVMFLQLFKRKTVVYLVLLPFSMVAVAALLVNLNLGW